MTTSARNIKYIMYTYIVIFIMMYIYYAIAGYREYVPGYMLFLQSMYFVSYTCSLLIFSKYRASLKSIALHTFIYSLVTGFLVRTISWEFMNEPFLGGVDSYTYDWLAKKGVLHNYSYKQFLSFVNLSDFESIDDAGMPSIVFWTYKLFGSGLFGQNILIVFNAIVISVSAIVLERILIYFDIHQPVRNFCVIAYTCFPFLSFTAAVGLKENFFVLIILCAFYNISKYADTKHTVYLLGGIVSIFGCLFFRIAIFAMIIISLIVSLLSKESNKNSMLYMIIIGTAIGLISLNIVINYLYGRELEAIIAINEFRTADASDSIGSNGTWIVQILSLVFGPFANFSRIAGGSAIVYSSGVLLKGVLCFPIICGIFDCIKKRLWQYYTLLSYFFMSAIMFVIVGVALDMRYQITMFPLLIPFGAKFIECNKLNRLYLVYIIILIILIWKYNLR